MQPAITLVYFSCQGREHLLVRTVEAFEKYQTVSFHEKILAFDGPLEPAFPVAELGLNKLVNNVARAGYVPSVQNVLPLITTPYFFWQEDDCRCLRSYQIPYLLEQMEAHPNWTQVGWGIGEKFPVEEKIHPLGPSNMYQTAYGFSARPALCRTSDLRQAFAMGEGEAVDANQYIEPYVRAWLKHRGKLSVSIDPGEESVYVHEGQLESTDRSLHHMTPTKTDVAGRYTSGLGHKSLPSLWRRIKNFFDLLVSSLLLACQQFYSISRYDVAWRVVRIERVTRL